MRKRVKDFLVPHEGNDHKPRLFELSSLATLTVSVLALFVLTFVATSVIRQSNMVATVLPGVLVDLANQSRVADSENQLIVNPELQAAAQMKANDMAARGYFAHYSPDGLSPWYWISKAGYNFSYAGENLAVNYNESGDVNQAWLNSPTHRANILNNHFTEIGIATARGEYKGQQTTFVVQMFGRPKTTVVARSALTPTTSTPTPSTISEPATTEVSTGTPVVAGAEVDSDTLVVTDSGRDYLAVHVAGAETSVNEPASGVTVPAQSPWWAWLIVRPGTITGILYMGILLFVFVDMIFMIFIEIRKQHYGSILLALSFLAVVSTLFFLSTYSPLTNIVLNFMVTTA